MNKDMMSRLAEMQEKLAKAQEEIESRIAEGTSGGGAVKVEITGGWRVQSLKIDPEVVDPNDVEMLEDLIVAATNEALQQVQTFQAGGLSDLTGGLGIPGLPSLPGLGAPGAGAPPAPGGSPAAPPPMNRAARRAQKR